MENLLVTGGTGSVGRAVIDRLLQDYPDVKRIVIYSRDEHKQGDMARELAAYGEQLEFILGDINNHDRLTQALYGIDTVIHTAAMRLVPHAEANPEECIRTNVDGARSLVAAVRRSDVKKVVAISSDKAVAPTTIYGASKFAMERILIDADRRGGTRFSMVRYANVLNSRSSVAPLFLRQRETGVLTITDPEMTRFSIVMDEGVDLVLFAAENGWGGEIICPISPSYRVQDMADAIAPEAEHQIIGRRPGEKVHEVMFSLTEAPFVMQTSEHYILSPHNGRWSLSDYCNEASDITPISTPFEYNSGSNSSVMSVQDLKTLITMLF